MCVRIFLKGGEEIGMSRIHQPNGIISHTAYLGLAGLHLSRQRRPLLLSLWPPSGDMHLHRPKRHLQDRLRLRQDAGPRDGDPELPDRAAGEVEVSSGLRSQQMAKDARLQLHVLQDDIPGDA